MIVVHTYSKYLKSLKSRLIFFVIACKRRTGTKRWDLPYILQGNATTIGIHSRVLIRFWIRYFPTDHSHHSFSQCAHLGGGRYPWRILGIVGVVNLRLTDSGEWEGGQRQIMLILAHDLHSSVRNLRQDAQFLTFIGMLVGNILNPNWVAVGPAPARCSTLWLILDHMRWSHI